MGEVEFTSGHAPRPGGDKHWLAYRQLLVATFRPPGGRLARLVFRLPGQLTQPRTNGHAFLCSRSTRGWRWQLIAGAGLACLAALIAAAPHTRGPTPLTRVALGAALLLAVTAANTVAYAVSSRLARRHHADRYVTNVVRVPGPDHEGQGRALLESLLANDWAGQSVALHARAAPPSKAKGTDAYARAAETRRRQRALVAWYESMDFVLVKGDAGKRPLMVRPAA